MDEPLRNVKLKVLKKLLPKLTVAVDVFGESLFAKCLSKNLEQKYEGIESLKQEIETFLPFSKSSDLTPGKFFKASCQIVFFLLKSRNWSVYQSACGITISLYEGVAEEYTMSPYVYMETTEAVLSLILSRSGDPVQGVHDLSMETAVKLFKMPQMKQNDFLDLLLTATIAAKEPVKAALSRIKFTRFLVEEFGTN